MDRFTGGCLCGNVRIVSSGLPCRVGLCHCLDCRKHHGALFHASAVFPQDAVTIKNGTAPHINSFELGQHGRYRTNVWQYRGVNTLKAGRMDELALHPTVKPVVMIADAIKDVSSRNGIVLDLFAGSGSTLIAAHKTGRRAFLCELDPLYCDRIVRRWQIYSKDDATLQNSGQNFDEVGHQRTLELETSTQSIENQSTTDELQQVKSTIPVREWSTELRREAAQQLYSGLASLSLVDRSAR